MADRTFSFRVISPLGTAFQGDARSVTLPTADGEITVLANHMPLVAVLTDGELRIDTGEKMVSVAVAGGFLETGGLVGEPVAAPGVAAPGGVSAGRLPAHRRSIGGKPRYSPTLRRSRTASKLRGWKRPRREPSSFCRRRRNAATCCWSSATCSGPSCSSRWRRRRAAGGAEARRLPDHSRRGSVTSDVPRHRGVARGATLMQKGVHHEKP